MITRLRNRLARRRADLLRQYRRRWPRLEGTLFIVTYGRSGSTVLQAILNTIPGAEIRGENFDTLGALYVARSRAAEARSTWGQKTQPADHPWHGADRIDPVGLEQSLTRAFAEHVLAPSPNARWIGCKEIRFQPYQDDLPEVLDMLLRAFPNAFILFNSRDGAEVAQSRWWKNQPPEHVAAMVAGMDERFASYHAAHPDRSFHLTHADTIADPESLRPLFEALGEEFDVEALRAVLSNRLNH